MDDEVAAGDEEEEEEEEEGREEMEAEGSSQKVEASRRKMQAASWRKVGQLSLLRLSTIFQEYPALDYSHFMPRFLDSVSVRSFPTKRN
jgi:hypothetical protein